MLQALFEFFRFQKAPKYKVYILHAIVYKVHFTAATAIIIIIIIIILLLFLIIIITTCTLFQSCDIYIYINIVVFFLVTVHKDFTNKIVNFIIFLNIHFCI